MCFSLYTEYHILFKMQASERERKEEKQRLKQTEKGRQEFKNQIKRERKQKNGRKMTDLHKKGVYKKILCVMIYDRIL